MPSVVSRNSTRARVVGARVEVDAQLWVTGEWSHDADQLERNANAESVGDARRVIDDLPRAAVGREARREHIRVLHVTQVSTHLVVAVKQPECSAALGVEKSREDGRRIE